MKKAIKIKQGSTFEWVIRWESNAVAFKPITAITQAAPPVLTVTSHGLPTGWRAAVQSVKGMTAINAENDPLTAADFHTLTSVSTNTLSLDGVNASGYAAYSSGGILVYYPPIDLSQYTAAKMQIRPTVDSATILAELSIVNGKITLDNTLKTITAKLTNTETSAFTFQSAVYSLEMTKASGDVIELLYGPATLDKEVTR